MEDNLKLAWADFLNCGSGHFPVLHFIWMAYIHPLLGDKIFVNISTVFYRVKCALFYMENDVEIFPAHYTWKVAEKEFKMAFMK